jgi:hypothetical protein
MGQDGQAQECRFGAPRAARPRCAPMVRMTKISVQLAFCMTKALLGSSLSATALLFCPICDLPDHMLFGELSLKLSGLGDDWPTLQRSHKC